MEQQSDHDLLIKLHEQVEGIRSDIKELKDDTKERIKTGEVRTSELEVRVTWLERIAYGGMAILGAVEFYFKVLK